MGGIAAFAGDDGAQERRVLHALIGCMRCRGLDGYPAGTTTPHVWLVGGHVVGAKHYGD